MATSVTRRGVLYGAAAAALIPFPEWFDQYGKTDAAGPFVRRSVATAQGAQMLATYASVVGTMMPRPTGDPCGWTFQWYTHQIRSDLQKPTVITGLPPAQRPLATDMWNTCQAHGGRPLQYFLPWHRMYVYFLERIVRAKSGNPNFALPYWNYIDVPQRPIPAPFRTNAASPLYRATRNNGSPGTANVNGGQPIDFGQPANTINLDCMNQPTYAAGPGGAGFNAAMNQNPHGIVHSLIGNSQGMGSVPWAANDPVFWLHHCNVDRLWATWNRTHANPTDAGWRDQQFVFADEKCNRVLVKVSDFEKIAPLGYTYDTLPARIVVNAGLLERLRRVRLIAQVRLPGRPIPQPDPGPVRIRLDGDRTVLPLVTTNNAPLVKSLGVGAQQRLRLRVVGLRADVQPGVLYHVYLNLPQTAPTRGAEARFVGAITFFDAVPIDHAPEHKDHDMGADAGPSFEFDVTDLVKRLGAPESLSVTIVPAGTPARDAAPSIATVELSVAE